MDKGKVKLIAPAKIDGKRVGVGATPEVSADQALQLAEAGAIEITSDDLAKLRQLVNAETDAGQLSTEQLMPIVELMRGETSAELKTASGNWSVGKLGKALGRDLSQGEVDAAAIIAANDE